MLRCMVSKMQPSHNSRLSIRSINEVLRVADRPNFFSVGSLLLYYEKNSFNMELE